MVRVNMFRPVLDRRAAARLREGSLSVVVGFTGLLFSVAFAIILLSISAPVAGAQSGGPLEYWSGDWVDVQASQGGHLEFLLTDDGMINGSITNGTVVGLWSGYVRDDGVMFATYSYPDPVAFSARAIGRATQAQGNVIAGPLLFVDGNNQIFSVGEFQLARTYASPQAANPRGYEYPFTGNGLYVYCSAPSICGQRGANALPGNWGWTSGLFSDIKRNYPQVWCNLYPGSC